MKTLIITIITLASSFVQAQSFWNHVEDKYYYNKSHITDMALLQDSIILVGGYINDVGCPTRKLFSYHISGKRLWNKSSTCDLVTTDSNYIYTAGYTYETAVFGEYQLEVSKYDKYGIQTFRIDYPEVPHDLGFYFKPKNIEIVSDGMILVSSIKSIAKTNINGDFLRVYDVSLESDINAIHAITPVSYIINTQDKIYKTDTSFSLLDSIQFPDSISKAMLRNDTILALINSSLVRLDTDLIIIDTIYSSPVKINNFEIFENNIWLYFTQPDSIKMINIDKNIPSGTRTFPLLANKVESIVSGNNFVFAGNSFTGQRGVYDFNTENDKVPDFTLPDIELLDFELDSLVIKYDTPPNDSSPFSYSFNTKMEVKNTGPDTITSFTVFSELFSWGNCPKNFFYQHLEDINLYPGQTQTFVLNRTHEFAYSSELCYLLMAPNSKLEKETDNNYLCKTFKQLNNKVVSTPEITIYPNPTTDYVNIECSGFDIKHVDILDINGKREISQAASGQNQRIEMGSLIPGIYIVRINSGEQIISKLIIKN